MNILYVLIGIIILSLIWFIPSFIIAAAVKKIIKKKISKGWCILLSLAALCICTILEAFIIGVHHPGILDIIIRFACLSVIFYMLYDKSIPSIFDTEKELKNKRDAHADN